MNFYSDVTVDQRELKSIQEAREYMRVKPSLVAYSALNENSVISFFKVENVGRHRTSTKIDSHFAFLFA